MKQGVCKFKLKENADDKPQRFYDLATGAKRAGPSNLEHQRRFLANLHAAGYEPFDMDEDGFQYWRRKTDMDSREEVR